MTWIHTLIALNQMEEGVTMKKDIHCKVIHNKI